jgi:hypothetical protein
MRSKKKKARRSRSPRVTTIGVLGVVLAGLGAAILMASHESSSRLVRLPTVDAAPSLVAPEPTAKQPPAARTQSKPTVTASAVKTVPVARSAEGVAAKTAAGESTDRSAAPEATPVTITGCLERDNTTFRLKDAAGTEAPKSRSWKKGFLKKGAAPIDVVDPANRLSLSSHVGQRVSVTGLLVDREMTLRSLQRVAASCN